MYQSDTDTETIDTPLPEDVAALDARRYGDAGVLLAFVAAYGRGALRGNAGLLTFEEGVAGLREALDRRFGIQGLAAIAAKGAGAVTSDRDRIAWLHEFAGSSFRFGQHSIDDFDSVESFAAKLATLRTDVLARRSALAARAPDR